MGRERFFQLLLLPRKGEVTGEGIIALQRSDIRVIIGKAGQEPFGIIKAGTHQVGIHGQGRLVGPEHLGPEGRDSIQVGYHKDGKDPDRYQADNQIKAECEGRLLFFHIFTCRTGRRYIFI